MTRHVVLVLAALVHSVLAAKKEVSEQTEPLTPAELAHKRKFFSIGEGFEGSASDWTEYVVWVIGVIGVFYYMANPNARRNLHAVEDGDEGEEGDDDGPTRSPQPRDDKDAALFGREGHSKED